MNKTQLLLICLMEECAEVQQACSKALRFGLQDFYNEESNQERLCNEMRDLLAVFALFTEVAEISMDFLDEKKAGEKVDKLEKYFKYSESKGILDEQS